MGQPDFGLEYHAVGSFSRGMNALSFFWGASISLDLLRVKCLLHFLKGDSLTGWSSLLLTYLELGQE